MLSLYTLSEDVLSLQISLRVTERMLHKVLAFLLCNFDKSVLNMPAKDAHSMLMECQPKILCSISIR